MSIPNTRMRSRVPTTLVGILVLGALLLATLGPSRAHAELGLVKDLVAGPGGSSPRGFAKLNTSTAVFFATIPGVGDQLWRTDGTALGTIPVMTAAPESTTGVQRIRFVVAMAPDLVVYSILVNTGLQLWRTDGTVDGTYLLTTKVSSSSESLDGFKLVGGRLFFTGNDGSGDRAWITDGTLGGTGSVANLLPGLGLLARVSDLFEYSGAFFFNAPQSGVTSVWRTDGQAAPVIVHANANILGVAVGRIVAKGGDGFLFNSLGTSASVTAISDGIGGLSNVFALQDGGSSAFALRRANNGDWELWKIDSGLATLLKVVASFSQIMGGGFLGTANGKVFLDAGGSLWASNGSAGGTMALPSGPKPTIVGSGVSQIVSTGAKVYFSSLTVLPSYPNPAFPSATVLWQTDGTQAGSHVAAMVCMTNWASGLLPSAVELNGDLLIGGSECSDDTELRKLSPTGGELAAVPFTIPFGGYSKGASTPNRSVTFFNSGDSSLSILSITGSSGFAVSQHDCGLLAPTQSCTAQVTFTPTSTGSMAGSLTVQTSVGVRTYPLSGVGENTPISHYYMALLGRSPDTSGASFWTSQAALMASLGASAQETWFAMALSFLASPEYLGRNRTDADFVEDLYRAFFNRVSDSPGAAFWNQQLAQGMPREVVVVSFLLSSEFSNFTASNYGNSPARPEVDMVMDFYRGLLHRLPDASGLGFWLARFRVAQCGGAADVIAQADSISALFLGSAEYLNRGTSDPQFVGDLYNTFLRRGGELGGVQYWIDQIAHGQDTREGLRKRFVKSIEFGGRVDAVIAAGCLP